jgi:hypothetical protein
VEQKNWSVVRRNVGYLRYDTEEEVKSLNELSGHLRLSTNFFQPTMKSIEKTRMGSRVKRRYDLPKTPHRRVLLSPDVSEQNKERLKEVYARLNPAEPKRAIGKLQDKLYKLCLLKEEKGKKEVLSALVPLQLN